MTAPAATQAPQGKARPDDTRARIVETAEALFRRLGFAKTAVADIAAELDMSPANIYRFFSSKNAIVDAICQRCLSEVEEKMWAAARSRAPAAARMEKLFLEIFNYHKDNLISEQRVHDIVLVAIENNWDAIAAHTRTMCTVIELIVRDGIESGEFEAVEPTATAELIKRSMLHYCHPLMVADALRERDEATVENDVRASVRFLIRAITPRR